MVLSSVATMFLLTITGYASDGTKTIHFNNQDRGTKTADLMIYESESVTLLLCKSEDNWEFAGRTRSEDAYIRFYKNYSYKYEDFTDGETFSIDITDIEEDEVDNIFYAIPFVTYGGTVIP